MGELKRWQVNTDSPYMLRLAADARISQTHQHNDHVWLLEVGDVHTETLTLQTDYGRRVKQTNLRVAWWHNNRAVLQYQAYAVPPIFVSVAPGFARTQGQITADIHFIAEFWVMESQAVGVRYTLTNNGHQTETLRADLLADVLRESSSVQKAIHPFEEESLLGQYALSLGFLPELEPMVMLEGATIADLKTLNISAELTIPAGQSQKIRWVHAGLSTKSASLALAKFWLSQDWDKAFANIEAAAQAIPQIETGDPDTDAALAFSYQQLLQSVIRPDEGLPYALVDSTRCAYPTRGYNSPPQQAWLTPHTTYLSVLALASVDSGLAQDAIKNFFALQQADGSIDMALQAGKSGLLCPPILARLTWEIYQLTEDLTFLKEAYPKLLAFFNRWSSSDVDADYDILPEYQDERQTGYTFWPTFGSREKWAQNADIRLTETPDMAAYLLAECVALASIAREIGDAGAYELANRLTDLRRLLDALWREDLNRYAYRDRDTDITTRYLEVLPESRADEEHLIALDLAQPSRVILRLLGGTSAPPKATISVTGAKSDGTPYTETLSIDEKRWGYGFGTMITDTHFTRIDRMTSDGLSRVYKLTAYTADYSRLDINAVLPIILEGLPAEKSNALVDLLKDSAHFLQPNGLTIVSASDADYDPASARGGGGVWPYWLTLIGEGLIANGHAEEVVIFLKRLLKVQAIVLKETKQFAQFYHAEEAVGLGIKGHVSGIVPLYLVLRLMGVQIVNYRRVHISAGFAWGDAVTITQHHVTVTRSAQSIEVTFPTGYSTVLTPTDDLQTVEDPSVPLDLQPYKRITPPIHK